VLNKVAQREARRRAGCRVVAIGWGPWDGGMVGPELRREIEREGAGVIPIDAGARAFVAELAAGTEGAIEVVISAPAPSKGSPEPSRARDAASSAAASKLSSTFRRALDVAR